MHRYVLDHKEAWLMKSWYFQTVVLEKTLENPRILQGDQTSQSYRKATLKIHWKDWCWSWRSNTLATWCKEPTQWKRPHSLEKTLMLGKIEDKRRRGWQRMKWLESITDSMDINLNKFQETVEDRGAWAVAVHGVAKSWTLLSNWKTTIYLYPIFSIKF